MYRPRGSPLGIQHNAHTRTLCWKPACMSYPPDGVDRLGASLSAERSNGSAISGVEERHRLG
jgi:hypothetical protein